MKANVVYKIFFGERKGKKCVGGVVVKPEGF